MCVQGFGIDGAFAVTDGVLSRAHRVGGTLLSLAIVRPGHRLAAGSIDIDSVPGRGTTVSVTIPQEVGGSGLSA